MMRLIIVVGLLFSISLLGAQSLIISEVVSKNTSGLEDFEGETPDWIELQNISDQEIWLDDFYLSDDKEKPDKWNCPKIFLYPNEYIYFLASGKDTFVQNFHTNFKIKQSGESIFVSKQFNGGIQIIDQLSAICIPTDFSAGRTSNSNSIFIFSKPTAGQSNSSTDIYLMPSDSVVWDLEAGFYTQDQFLNLSTSLPSTIKYTLNGDIPKADDLTFTLPFLITSDSISDVSLALHPSSNKWKMPMLPLARSLVVSAKPFHMGCPIGPLENRTYFMSQYVENDQIGHVSLVIAPDDFIGAEGIYVEGLSGENYLKRGKAWEKKGFLEYFDELGEKLINEPVGVRIHGSGSRNDPHKSLRVYLRNEYGKESIENAFWENRSDTMNIYSFVLNSGQSDFTKSLLKDHFSANVLDGMHLDDQKSKLVKLYINGEYWGLQFIQEHISSNHIASLYGMESAEVNILEDEGHVSVGDGASYETLLSFVKAKDLSDSNNYQHVESMMDMDNFIDYNLVNLYFSNWDWPENNVKLWNSDQSDYELIRWVLTDCDACFYVSDYNSLKNLNEDDSMHPRGEHQIILSKLLTNQHFSQKFKIRAHELMDLNFNPNFLLHKLDSIVTEIEPHLPEHIARWHYPESMESWNSQVKEMKYFIINRHTYFIQNLEKLYNIPFFAYPNPASSVINIPAEASKLNLEYKLFDFTGTLLKQGSNQYSSLIDINNFESGAYILNFETTSGLSWNQRMIIIQ